MPARETAVQAVSRFLTPRQPETAVTRVTAFLEARRRKERTGTIVLEAEHHPGSGVLRLPLTDADLAGLLGIIHDLCPDTIRCGSCDVVACETCGVGEVTDCDPPHCPRVECWCGECRDDEARGRSAEQRADTDREEAAR
ncbi:MAG: hypothetical protein ACRDUV_13470 [Pseudonocardiaceae bacterium]